MADLMIVASSLLGLMAKECCRLVGTLWPYKQDYNDNLFDLQWSGFFVAPCTWAVKAAVDAGDTGLDVSQALVACFQASRLVVYEQLLFILFIKFVA